jgi:hypothetical protein
MNPDDRKRTYRMDMLLACALIASGLAVSGLSLAQLNASNLQMAQATQPLQSTPGAETKPSAPPEPTTTGARPSEIPPQPAARCRGAEGRRRAGVAAGSGRKDRGPDQGKITAASPNPPS